MKKSYKSGLLHKLNISEFSRENFFSVDELFVVRLNFCIEKWLEKIVEIKIKTGKKSRIHFLDISKYSHELKEILDQKIIERRQK